MNRKEAERHVLEYAKAARREGASTMSMEDTVVTGEEASTLGDVLDVLLGGAALLGHPQESPGALSFDERTMSDLLTAAFEGGSDYWIHDWRYVNPPAMDRKALKRAAWARLPKGERETWKPEGPTGPWPLYIGLPFLDPSLPWQIMLDPGEGEDRVFLTPQNMRAASVKLAKSHPNTFARIKSEDWDAHDADVWLQIAVLGEEVFG